MPNWVKTRLKLRDVTDDRFAKIVEEYTTSGVGNDSMRDLDFERIIPMPDYVFRGNLGPAERLKYGANNWYDWSVTNWGTKWNAADGMIDYETHAIWFSTAWSFAEPVVKAFAKKLGCAIEADYADEDYGRNCGSVTFMPNGDMYVSNVEAHSPEAWAIVEDLWGVSNDE